jgi:hypothetical protein
MIIWLASYPKSGNTLIRALLSSYFFTQNGLFSFDLIKNISQFPSATIFQRLGVDIKNEKEVIKNYIRAQESINKKDSINFLKTHSYLFNINNNPFTDLNNSLGAIYIVRDPRNVVTSYAHHFNISVEKASERMINSLEYGGNLDSKYESDRTKVYLGSWSSNYDSWKSFKLAGKYLLIKYEDLLNNIEATLIKILDFIYKLRGVKFNIDHDKIKNIIHTTSFQYMRNLEKKKNFIESRINNATGKKIPFFNLGPQNDWRKLLDEKIRLKIESSFKLQMEELRYL